MAVHAVSASAGCCAAWIAAALLACSLTCECDLYQQHSDGETLPGLTCSCTEEKVISFDGLLVTILFH